MATETLAALSFFVRGVPVAKGSHDTFIRPVPETPRSPNPRCALCGKPRKQTVVVVDQSGQRLEDWMMAIRVTAHEAQGPGWGLWAGAVSVSVKFYFPRLKSHPKNNPPVWKLSKPDGDKLMRAVLDALTGVTYVDDNRVVELHCQKFYTDVDARAGDTRYGAEIMVSQVGEVAA